MNREDKKIGDLVFVNKEDQIGEIIDIKSEEVGTFDHGELWHYDFTILTKNGKIVEDIDNIFDKSYILDKKDIEKQTSWNLCRISLLEDEIEKLKDQNVDLNTKYERFKEYE